MHILFITPAHDSLSQRLQVELVERGHRVTVAVCADGAAMLDAAARAPSDLILAPTLKAALPQALWRSCPCLIVHPGIVGDRGPSSLDWAIQDGETAWGVTVLQAAAGIDAGPAWATHSFDMPLRPWPKSALYRHAVTESAVCAVLTAIARFAQGAAPDALQAQGPGVRGRWRPLMKQADRAIDWQHDGADRIVRAIRAADSSPGLVSTVFGDEHHLYGAHEEDRLRGQPGRVIARRHGAVCVGTVDGAVWITHLKRRVPGAIKLPAAQVLGGRLAGVPESALSPAALDDHRTWREIRYTESGAIGTLSFDFDNGAMNTEQCRRLCDAYRAARSRPTKVIVLAGGHDFFANGIHLNTIEAAADPAVESWRNINAMNDLVLDILTTPSHLTVAALRGNAGAGGLMLALAADRVLARRGAVLNPHGKGLDGLQGSAYGAYSLPRRVGPAQAQALAEACQPMGTPAAQRLGLIDDAFGDDEPDFSAQVAQRAEALAGDGEFWHRLQDKHDRRHADEQRKPLAEVRREEMLQMHLTLFGADPSYHLARRRFVHKGAPPQVDPAVRSASA
jgi:putative two-component system hydrogenase maturation factor HypX/HoxX